MIPRFRAWIKEEKCFADYIESIRFYINEIDLCWGGICESDCFDFKDVILMQSTGLYDKNGKEIFEGDIVKRDGIKRPEVVRFGEWIDVDTLGFEEQYIGFYFESEHEGQKRLYSVESKFNNLCKVIGNIYENPELLEVK
jgi:hypothetical protein